MNTTNVDTTLDTSNMGDTGNHVLVHKEGSEGSITIDRNTGYIVTPLDERPEWASELAIAQVAERHLFYVDRLGPLYTEDRQNPELLAFEDLGWIAAREYPVDAPYVDPETGISSDQELITISADHEFRQQQLATVMGIEAETDEHGNETGSIVGAQVEVEMAADNLRTPEELAELEAERKDGMKAVNE